MRRLFLAILGTSALVVMGCKDSSTTAPSTTPGNPEAVRKMTLHMNLNDSYTIKQDATETVNVGITRENFAEPVKITLSDLPTGVKVETQDLTIPAKEHSLTITLHANKDAPLTAKSPVKVTATALNEKDLQPVSETFKLTVKEK